VAPSEGSVEVSPKVVAFDEELPQPCIEKTQNTAVAADVRTDFIIIFSPLPGADLSPAKRLVSANLLSVKQSPITADQRYHLQSNTNEKTSRKQQ
jgi:hypothetical protein